MGIERQCLKSKKNNVVQKILFIRDPEKVSSVRDAFYLRIIWALQDSNLVSLQNAMKFPLNGGTSQHHDRE